MKVLITGASGFLGRHFLKRLREEASDEIHSIGTTDPGQPGVRHLSCELTEREAVLKAVSQIAPDRIYHLAGAARLSTNSGFPDFFRRNVLSTAYLLEGLADGSRKARFFLASSAHVYGNQQGVVGEETLPQPANPYGFSKYLAEETARKVSATSLCQVVIGRLYACIGPGQSLGFVVPDICRQLVNLKGTPGEVLKTGPLGGFRQFADARDVVPLFPKLLERGERAFEIFNIATQPPLSIQELVVRLVKTSGKSPSIQSVENPKASLLTSLRLNTEKLERAIPDLYFRPLDETLGDTYQWMAGTNDD